MLSRDWTCEVVLTLWEQKLHLELHLVVMRYLIRAGTIWRSLPRSLARSLAVSLGWERTQVVAIIATRMAKIMVSFSCR